MIKDERFKGLSSDAKLLYGLMLDRMSLSMKNGWLDDENRAYIIYTVDAIMEDLGCAKATCVKIMKELDTENGIGLIEKKRRGLGKPDIIYVKNFSTITDMKKEEKADNADISAEVQKVNLKKSNIHTSRSSEDELAKVHKVDPIYILTIIKLTRVILDWWYYCSCEDYRYIYGDNKNTGRTLLDTMSKGVREKRATKKALSLNKIRTIPLLVI